MIRLDRTKSSPLFEQLVGLIKAKINSGELIVGDKLPASRELAKHLSVSRTTVCRAYDELYALGYIESSQGSFSKIRKIEENTPKQENNQSSVNWQKLCSKKVLDVHQKITNIHKEKVSCTVAEPIDFISLAPAKSIMPIDDFRKCMNHVLKSNGAELLQYGETLGFLPLREFIAKHLRQHGIVTTADEIILTNGAQHAIDLITKLLLSEDDNIAVESPTYALILPLLNALGANINPIAMNENGLNLVELEKSIKRNKGKLLYTMPNFHNPTGISTSQEHREQLLQLCTKHNLPIVEDGFVDEMKYFGKTPLPIKAMDKHGLVIYIGSFSKILFPGIRIGWIVADKKLINLLGSLKQATSLQSNILDHAAINQFCLKGYYQQHIKRSHALYKKRMQIAIKMAKKIFPSDLFSFTTPNGGYLLFVSAKSKEINEKILIEAIKEKGVLVSSGSKSFAQNSHYAHFRISIAEPETSEIIEGFEKIGQAIAGLIK